MSLYPYSYGTSTVELMRTLKCIYDLILFYGDINYPRAALKKPQNLVHTLQQKSGNHRGMERREGGFLEGLYSFPTVYDA